MAKAVEIAAVERFDPNMNPTHLSQAWSRWLRGFELYATGKGVTDAAQKRALLLHHAGLPVQDIYFTLEEIGEEGDNAYQKCVKTLNKQFSPKTNTPYERYVFRKAQQEENETIEQYVTRLRTKSAHCGFVNADEAIRDHIIETCRSSSLRVKLLEKGDDLTLDELRKISNTMELSHIQGKMMDQAKSEQVNRVTGAKQNHQRTHGQGKTPNKQERKGNQKCFRCGNTGHFGKDPKCPARNQKCHKCQNIGHFMKCCKTKDKSEHVRQVNDQSSNDECDHNDFGYSFNVHTHDLSKQEVNVGNIATKVIIDSGSSANIVDKETWEYMKMHKIFCYSTQKTEKKLFSYGSSEPLNLLGEFVTDVSVPGTDKIVKKVTFYVIKNKAPAILSRNTAAKLGLLKLDTVCSINENILSEYSDCFSGLGKLSDFELKLHIDPSVKPVAQKMYSVPLSLRQKVHDKLDELVDLDVIEPTDGPTPWVSPVVVVPKPSGDIRLCVDMRQANQAIVRERHPIPTIDDVLIEMSDSQIFSKIDLNMGFHQIVLDKESRPITTFITHRGLYRYKRLNFGVNSAPEMFQHIISQVLQPCEGATNIADDIIVHGRDKEDHDAKLRKCMDTLRSRGLTVNLDKSRFNLDKVTFMGHVISGKGIGPTEERVKSLLEAERPKNASEVRSFLGLVNFSARYLRNVATVTEPLRELTKKNVTFTWGRRQDEAFTKLKSMMSESETLGIFRPGRRTKLVTDASNVGLGAVLIQEYQGKEKVISYASRTLTDVEKRYSTTEKEALAIVWACEKYNNYLYGSKFELITDHKPLEVIYSAKSKPSARIQRWILRLLPYSFEVKYKPGTVNIADFLSRVTVNEEKSTLIHESENDDDFIRFVAENATPCALSTTQVEKISSEDEELTELHKSIQTDQWKDSPSFMPVRYELSTIGHLVLRGTRIVIPRSLRTKCIQLAHEGHLGIVGTKLNLRSKVWWPKMDADVEKFVRSCYGCQLVSLPCNPEPLKPTEMPAGPWQDLAIDLMGPLPSGDYVFVCVDYYSRYYEIDIMKTITTEKIIDSLEKMFIVHGLPISITSDNGRQFVSEEFEKYLQDNDIIHRRITPLHPSANGEVERQNRSLLKRIKIAQAEGKNWKIEVRKYLLAYRTTPHNTTGISPSELLFKRKIKTKLPEIQFTLNDEQVRDRDMYMKDRNKQYIDRKRGAEERNLVVGEKVLLRQDKRDKLSTTFHHEPYTLLNKSGNQVVVESPEGVTKVRNSTHVKRYIEASEKEDLSTGASLNRFDENSNSDHSSNHSLNHSFNHSESETRVETQKESVNESQCQGLRRSARARQTPARFQDFEMG